MATIVDSEDETLVNGVPLDHEMNGAAVLRPSQAVAAAEFWRRPAPRRLRRGGATTEAAWKLLWSKRPERRTIAQLCGARGTPLLWAVGCDDLAPPCRALLEFVDKLSQRGGRGELRKSKVRDRLRTLVAEWLDDAQDGSSGVSDWQLALGCLAAAHALDAAGNKLPADLGWSVVDFLWSTAQDASHWEADNESPASAVLAQQLAAAELPLTLAHLFPEMAPLEALRSAGRQRLIDGIAELLNGEGLPHAGLLSAMRPLLACWTRCRALGEPTGKSGANARREFQRLVRQAIRWSDANRRLLLSGDAARKWSADFLAAALRASGRESDVAATRAQFPRQAFARRLPKSQRKLPAPATHSEWSALGLLRSDWSPKASIVAIDYSAADMRVDVRAGGRQLLAGVWSAESLVNGERLNPVRGWDQVCWFTDADVDYLEFRLPLTGGARLERQVLLAREDRFLLLADHLQHSEAAALEHSWQLPLADELQMDAEAETRDAMLSTGKPVARLLPLALPEWRVDPRVGELTRADGAVRLAERGHARALACPLLIDLDARRARKPCTWRQLTVAEALHIVTPDVAVGYRAQSGRDQWVFYRSQAERGNRTFLGQNTSNEFMAARFLSPSGAIEELVEVQG